MKTVNEIISKMEEDINFCKKEIEKWIDIDKDFDNPEGKYANDYIQFYNGRIEMIKKKLSWIKGA